MSEQSEPGSLGAEGQQAERWLATLRNGSPAEKAVARRGLAALFERRGMVAEAIDMLVANAREGYRDVKLFQALSRLYRAQGDEYLAASAALEATRLRGRQPQAARPPHGTERVQGGPGGSQAPWGHGDRHRPQSSATPGPAASWHRPTRIAGWLAVLGTLLAAATVASTSAISGALYLVSAAALGLLLAGSLAPRRLLRLPAGPLGDGALLFGWLVLVLVAGAILPRGPGSLGDIATPYQTPTPGLYRTPVATPSPSPSPGP